MDRRARTFFLLVMLAVPLAGCGSGFGSYDFDPTDLIPNDLFGTKKKLPGERKPVFPEGVPGTTRGIPPDLVKGYQPTADAAQDPLSTATPKQATSRQATPQQAAVERDEPKPKSPAPKAQPNPKPAPKTTTAATQSGQPTIDARWPDSTPTASAPQRQAPQPPTGPQWPDPPTARNPPAGPQVGGGQVQWPDPPATGAFPR